MKYTIPIKIKDLQEGSFHIFLKGKVNGHTCRFILDTGASRSVLDKGFYTQKLSHLSYDESEEKGAGIGTTTMETGLLKVKELSLENKRLPGRTFTLIDLSHVNDTYRSLNLKTVHGIIGSDFLKETQAVIDFKKSILKIELAKKQIFKSKKQL